MTIFDHHFPKQRFKEHTMQRTKFRSKSLLNYLDIIALINTVCQVYSIIIFYLIRRTAKLAGIAKSSPTNSTVWIDTKKLMISKTPNRTMPPMALMIIMA
jgi:hypothetical protein